MIKQIRLINCQSWQDATINFSLEKLNVICARNQTGKSVIFKMLKVLACPKYYKRKKMRKLIRWGADCATMFLLFDDDSVGGVSVFPTRVIYRYRRKGERDFIVTESPIQEMLEKAGLISDVKGAFVANIIDTDQDMLLVDSDLGSNADLMKMLVYNDDLNAIKDRSASLVQQFRDPQLSVDMRIDELNRMIKDVGFVDVISLEEALLKQRLFHNMLFVLLDAYKNFENFSELCVDWVDWAQLLELCKIAGSLESCDLKQLTVTRYPDVKKELAVLEELECGKFAEIGVRKFTGDFAALRVLQDLENVSFTDVTVKTETVIDEFWGAYEALKTLEASKLNLADISAIQEEQHFRDAEVLLTVLTVLENTMNENTLVNTKNAIAVEAGHKAKQLREEFENSGTIYECLIYGEVVFNGEKCISSR